MSNDPDRKPALHEQPALARLIAVVAGVIGFFGLILWVGQE